MLLIFIPTALCDIIWPSLSANGIVSASPNEKTQTWRSHLHDPVYAHAIFLDCHCNRITI